MAETAGMSVTQMEFPGSAEQPGGMARGHQVLQILHYPFLSPLAVIPNSGLIFYNLGSCNDFLVGLHDSSLYPLCIAARVVFSFCIIYRTRQNIPKKPRSAL